MLFTAFLSPGVDFRPSDIHHMIGSWDLSMARMDDAGKPGSWTSVIAVQHLKRS
ncbi:hypothetical protein [Sinorhizobium meliloti]|uniref:hypothetical protein n=1 Tax=Rhizobium meliloti TaxID=382 RepID=UPI0013E2F998|nr:hypothetical protein [Sinorhizobium meliloti]